MSAEKKKQAGVLSLVIALVVVLFGSILFVGLVSGWFDNSKVTLNSEYVCKDDCDGEYLEIGIAEYEELIKAKKSFVVFVDQSGCDTADKLRGFTSDYAKKEGIKVHKMMFSDVKESSLHESVKYYPSVVIVSNGKIVGFLKADSDDDSPAYNSYDEFEKWVGKYL